MTTKIFNFKARWLLVPLVLLTLGVGNAWGTDLTYNFASFSQASTVTLTAKASNPTLTIQLLKNDGSTSPQWSSSQARIYVKGSMKITSSSDNITQIVYYFTQNQGGSNPNKAYPTGYTMSTGSSSISGTQGQAQTITWTGSATIVELTVNGAKGNYGFTKVVITYGSGYSITYHCNDATSGCPSDASGQTALPNPLPSAPTKTGFTFGGWYTDAALTSAASAGASLSANADLYAKWTCNVTLNRNGATETINNVVEGTDLDDIDGTGAQGGCSAWTFVGWSKTQRAAQNNTAAMTLVTTVDGAGPYYAVYSHTEAGGGTSYTSVSAGDVTEGTYVIAALKSSSASSTYYAATGAVNSDNDMTVEGTGFTLTDGAFSSIPDGGAEFTFTGNNTDGFTITSANGNLYTTNVSTSRKLAFQANNSATWKVYDFTTPLNTNGIYLQYYNGSSTYYTISENSTAAGAIRGYTGTTKYRAIYLFKKGTGSTTYYSTTATCCTELGTINGSFLRYKRIRRWLKYY